MPWDKDYFMPNNILEVVVQEIKADMGKTEDIIKSNLVIFE